MSTTFAVSDVKTSEARLESTTLGASLKGVLNSLSEPEASGANVANLITPHCHGFVQAVHTAFDAHDWPGAFTEFSDQIGEYIGKKRDLLEEGGVRPATGWAVREPKAKRERKRI